MQARNLNIWSLFTGWTSLAEYPTITGVNVEETILVHPDSIEVLTKSKGWPMINIDLGGKIYPQPGILIKDPNTGGIIKQETKTIKL